VHLELAGGHGPLHVDAGVGEPPEMVFASLGIDEVERLVPLVEAVLDERPKDAVMLFHAIEERADVPIPALESVRRNLQGRVVSLHAHLRPETDGCNEKGWYLLATSASSPGRFSEPLERRDLRSSSLGVVRRCIAARF
jgi:hypothetical protein